MLENAVAAQLNERIVESYVPRRFPYQRICIRSQYRKPGFRTMALTTRRPRPSLRSCCPAASPRHPPDRPGVLRRPRSVRRSPRASRRQTSVDSHPLARSAAASSRSAGGAAHAAGSSADARSGSGVLEANLGLIDIRSHSTSRSIVPAVSIVTCNPWRAASDTARATPSAAAARHRSRRRAATSTRRPIAGSNRTKAAIPLGFHDAYGVSQNQHRRLHPLVRMKKLSVPVSLPSPWRLVKVSAMRSVPLVVASDPCENPELLKWSNQIERLEQLSR